MATVRATMLLLLIFGAHSAQLSWAESGSRTTSGRQLVIQAPKQLTPAQVSVTAAAPDGADNTTIQTGSENATRSDISENKIINPTTSSQIFLNYGLALTAAIYGLIGIGYFYGPYSVDAFLAKQRSEHRKDFLRQRLVGVEDSDEERDYGDYVEEELAVFREYGEPARTDGNQDQDYMYEDYSSNDRGVAQRLHAVTLDNNGHLVHSSAHLARRRGIHSPSTTDNHQHRHQSSEFHQRLGALVKVLDMRHGACQAWVHCVQQRHHLEQKQQQHIVSLPSSTHHAQHRDNSVTARANRPASFHAACDHYRRICPTKMQRLNTHSGHRQKIPTAARVGDVTSAHDVTTYHP